MKEKSFHEKLKELNLIFSKSFADFARSKEMREVQKAVKELPAKIATGLKQLKTSPLL